MLTNQTICMYVIIPGSRRCGNFKLHVRVLGNREAVIYAYSVVLFCRFLD